MWNSKGCPRCRGDIFIDEDVGGRFVKCLQCGYEKEIARTTVTDCGGSLKRKKLLACKAV